MSPATQSRGPQEPYAFVTLSPPLPCVDAEHGPGYVQALAQDGLLVQFTGAVEGRDESRTTELTIALSSGRTYAFRITLTGGTRQTEDGRSLHHATVIGLDQVQRLGDLLTLVRKSQHITICETMDVEASDRYTGFSDLTLVPKALPDLAWSELDTRLSFLGHEASLPLLITGMTGGLARGAEINRRLARAARAFGIPMGVGSQRVALDNPEHAAIFAVKKETPGVFLIGNLGITQLLGEDPLGTCRRAVEMIDADALAIHVNVLQELVQVEGDRDFRGLLDRVAHVAGRLGVPLLVKEVGGGIDPATAAQLLEAGVRAIDCGGKGGTSWSFIEGVRAESPVTRSVADTFRDWGIPTAVAVATLRKAHPAAELVATGGIRDGLTVAKAVGLGATLCGVGLPLLRAALAGEDDCLQVVETLAQGLKTAMLCSGSRTLGDLSGRLHVTDAFREAARRYIAPSAF